MDASDAYAQLDRLRGIKQAMKLSIEQEKLWAPVEEALTNLREQRRALRSTMTADEPTDQIERLRRRAELTTQRADALKKLADAAQPLWATLSEEQKRELTQSLSMGPSRTDPQRRMSHREDDDAGLHRRHHRGRDTDQDRTYRDRRDLGDSDRRDHRDRMTGRRGYDNGDDDLRRDRSDAYQRRSHDDYRGRARRSDRDPNDYDHRSERDDCRCGRRY